MCHFWTDEVGRVVVFHVLLWRVPDWRGTAETHLWPDARHTPTKPQTHQSLYCLSYKTHEAQNGPRRCDTVSSPETSMTSSFEFLSLVHHSCRGRRMRRLRLKQEWITLLRRGTSTASPLFCLRILYAL